MPDDLFSTFPQKAMAAKLQELADRQIYVGTSSWKYEGWLGQIYDEQRYIVRKRFSQKRFEQECISEYAQTLHTVCVDAGYYAFPTELSMARLAGAVPEGFKLAFKVTDEVTTKYFPSLPRYGVRGGTENPYFLNAANFIDRFLGPCLPFQQNLGPLIFEFSPHAEPVSPHPDDFLSRLDVFLAQLPKDGWRYAVEVRDKQLLRADYFQMLASHNVAHVLNSWTRMPPIHEQLTMEGINTADFTVARFLVKPGTGYQKSVDRFSPYNQTKEVYPAGRKALSNLINGQSVVNPADKLPKFLYINNRLEGNALNTILAAILSEKIE